MAEKENKQRLQFDFTDEMVERIDRCKDRMEDGSRAEVVRRALALMQLCLDEELLTKDPEDGVIRKVKMI